jgi:hypothetical protein
MGDSYNGCSSALNAGLDAIFFLKSKEVEQCQTN